MDCLSADMPRDLLLARREQPSAIQRRLALVGMGRLATLTRIHSLGAISGNMRVGKQTARIIEFQELLTRLLALRVVEFIPARPIRGAGITSGWLLGLLILAVHAASFQ